MNLRDLLEEEAATPGRPTLEPEIAWVRTGRRSRHRRPQLSRIRTRSGGRAGRRRHRPSRGPDGRCDARRPRRGSAVAWLASPSAGAAARRSRRRSGRPRLARLGPSTRCDLGGSGRRRRSSAHGARHRPMAKNPEPCISCGQDTAAGSLFYSDRRVLDATARLADTSARPAPRRSCMAESTSR